MTDINEMEGPPLSVLCTGYDMVDGHVEYMFHVTHASGCAWKTQKRFSELLAAYQSLAQSFQSVPAFPPRGIPGAGLFLGEKLILQRVVGLQQYFEEVMARRDLSRNSELHLLLGVQPPSTVQSVRVRGWQELPETQVGGTAWVELEVALPELAQGFSGPPERVEVAIQPIGSVTTSSASSSSTSTPVRISGLPCGEEVAAEIRAANCAGASDAVIVRLRVPGKQAQPLDPGTRVRAVWAGDGGWYDAVVHSSFDGGSSILVNWLRPAPLSGEAMHCVCESGGNGGDDTTHRVVKRSLVDPLHETFEIPTPKPTLSV